MSVNDGPVPYCGYRRQLEGESRLGALAAIVGLHLALAGVFVLGAAQKRITPPEPTLTVSFVTESAQPAAPSPPQPPPPAPPPERQMIATPRPTPSPMSAPPADQPLPPVQSAPAPPTPAPPAPPSAAASAAPGPSITPPNFTAAYLNNPGPAYPAASRRKKEEGTVRLRVQVSAEGAPSQVSIDRSSGFAELDNAAVDVVKRRWRFAPAKQGDRAVSAWVIVPMEFSLKSR